MILGENGEKMSKSRGNVVNPDDIIDIYGADTLRLYEVFIGDFEKVATWNTQSIKGSKRFLDRLWVLQDMVKPGDAYSAKHETLMHQTIKKVGSDIDELKGNTAIAQLMTLLNQFYDAGELNEAEYKTFLILVNPFCPHITEELWERAGYEGHISDQNWPLYDEAKTVEDTVEIAVQVNGKVRGRVVIAIDMEKDQVLALAKEDESVKRNIEGKSIVKEIYIPGRLVNIVVK
jgi:leucyl-tRNA synthetase